MNPIEFQTELHGEATLALPADVVAQLPSSGRATVVMLVQTEPEDVDWRTAAYEQFLRDDDSDDSIYDSY